MKKFIGSILILFACILHPTYASNHSQLGIKISGVNKNKYYYLCIYGVGCLNIKAYNEAKFYPVEPMDLGNIKKLVITDIRNMQMYPQVVNSSCHIQIKNDQKIIISGHLNVINNQPVLNNINCSVR